jgi:hypothetical protein
MEITKKQWTIIGVVIALIAIWYFFLRKKTESNYRVGRGYNPGRNAFIYSGRPLVGGTATSGTGSIYCNPPNVLSNGVCMPPIGGTSSITYVHKCTTKNADGTLNITTSFSSSPNSPCPSAKHEIIKVIA